MHKKKNNIVQISVDWIRDRAYMTVKKILKLFVNKNKSAVKLL